MKLLRLAAALLLAVPSGGLAQQVEAPICTDRPTKSNAVCTVPVGKWQLESSSIGWSRIKANGAETKVLTLGSSVVKVGLSARSDLQIGFTPYVDAKTEASGIKSRTSGFGDLTVRYKHRLTADGAPVQVSVIPFTKVPTAKRGIGNRKLEGGIALPVSIPVGGLTITLGPEADVLADADGHGRHLALVNLVNLSGPVAPRLTLAGELWSNFNFEPGRTIRQASADAALAYAVSADLQLDAGVNAGLTRDTPDIEFYAGLSFRL